MGSSDAPPDEANQKQDADGNQPCMQSNTPADDLDTGTMISQIEGGIEYRRTATAASGTETFSHEFNASQIAVDWTGDLIAGSITVSVIDGCGDQVYDSTIILPTSGFTRLSNGGGEPGLWAISVDLTHATGDIAFTMTATE